MKSKKEDSNEEVEVTLKIYEGAEGKMIKEEQKHKEEDSIKSKKS